MDEFKIRRVPRPWNKGRVLSKKAPLKLREIWAIRCQLHSSGERGNSRCSILASTVSCGPATCCELRVRDISLGERIAAPAIMIRTKRFRDRCSSRSRIQRAAL